MNFLAHLHIADHCNSHFMGNLLGDFVKGDPSKLYDSDITNGIKLHRFVDRITDHHPIVEECKPHFKGVARRFAPIALDMFWDHCLAKHWNDFHQESLDDFVEFAFQKRTASCAFYVIASTHVAGRLAAILSRSLQHRVCTASDVSAKPENGRLDDNV